MTKPLTLRYLLSGLICLSGAGELLAMTVDPSVPGIITGVMLILLGIALGLIFRTDNQTQQIQQKRIALLSRRVEEAERRANWSDN